MPNYNALDAAVTRFRSICAGEYCPACTSPTIVSSTGSPSPLNRCTCVRDIQNEWRAAAWMNEIRHNSLIMVNSKPVTLKNGGTDRALDTMVTSGLVNPEVGNGKRLRNHLTAIADFAWRNAGLADDDVTICAPGVSFADALRASLRPTTTVSSLSNDEAQLAGAYSPSNVLRDSETGHVLRQINSRTSSSRHSYYSIISQLPDNASGPEELLMERRKKALEQSQLDPVDFCPIQSTLLAGNTATLALNDIEKRTGRSAIEWLLWGSLNVE